MEIKQIIAAIVAVILITLVAIPIIDSMPATSYEYSENEQITDRLAYETNPTVEIEVLDASTNSLKIDSTTITYNRAFTIMSADFTLDVAVSTNAISFLTGQSKTNLATGDKISVTNGAWTFTPTSGSTQSGQIDWIFYPDNNGDWATFYNINAKVSADTTIYVAGSAAGVTGVAEGTVNGKFTQLFSYPSGSTMTVELNNVPIDGGLSYNADATGVITMVNGSNSSTGTGNGFLFAPIKYKIESADIVTTLVDIIPIILIVAVLLGIATTITSRRD